ncbi:MAG: hypothetical protein INQ03_04860 [Candidatus Heimdallarchaeota archaeon]|nr:hypothetical protein [Candidatus Heimdallarchaeota archaeon]
MVLTKDPDNIPDDFVDFEDMFSDINSPGIFIAKEEKYEPKSIILDGHSTLLVYSVNAKDTSWEAFHDNGSYVYTPDNKGDGAVLVPHNFYFEFEIELTGKVITVSGNFGGAGIKAIVMPMNNVSPEQFTETLMERLSNAFTQVLKPNDDQLTLVAGKQIDIPKQAKADLSFKLALLGISFDSIKMISEIVLPEEEAEYIEEIYENPRESKFMEQLKKEEEEAKQKKMSKRKKKEEKKKEPVKPIATSTPIKKVSPNPPPPQKKPEKKPAPSPGSSGPPGPGKAPAPAGGGPPGPSGGIPGPKTQASGPPGPSSGGVPPGPSGGQSSSKQVAGPPGPSAKKPAPSPPGPKGGIPGPKPTPPAEPDISDLASAPRSASKNFDDEEFDDFSASIADDELLPTSLKKEKKETVTSKQRYTHTSWFQRMIPNRAYPLKIKISTKELTKTVSISNIMTGEKTQEKVGSFQVTDTSGITIKPVIPGCMVVPSQAEINVEKDIEFDFYVTPLALGSLDARVEFYQNNQKFHTIDLDMKVINHRVSKMITYIGVLSSIIPMVFAFLMGMTFDDFMRDRLGKLLPELENMSYWLPLAITAFLGSGGLAFYGIRRPKMAQSTLSFPK